MQMIFFNKTFFSYKRKNSSKPSKMLKFKLRCQFKGSLNMLPLRYYTEKRMVRCGQDGRRKLALSWVVNLPICAEHYSCLPKKLTCQMWPETVSFKAYAAANFQDLLPCLNESLTMRFACLLSPWSTYDNRKWNFAT